ncbi:MAG: hypothetical protein IPO97_05520 [Sphingomonadales bacterium]|nr:hypothetical protein [Sphingomonadales bacterium]
MAPYHGVLVIFDRSNKITATEIRDKIKQINTSGGPCLVMQVHDDITWAGLNRAGRDNTFDWVKKSWPGE